MMSSKSTSTNTITISKHVLFIVLNTCIAAAVFMDAMNKMNDSYIIVVDNEVISYSKPANIITEWRY